MGEHRYPPNYNPEYCLKVARWTAAGCIAVLFVEFLVLLIVEPSASRCPGWIVESQESSSSLWLVVGMVTGLPTFWICYVVLRWDQKFSPMIYDSILRPRSMFGLGRTVEPGPLNLLLDFDRLFLHVCIGWGLFSAIPLGVMLFECTNLPSHLR